MKNNPLENVESKGMRVNMNKTKVMISGERRRKLLYFCNGIRNLSQTFRLDI